jgi:hypothetical protein
MRKTVLFAVAISAATAVTAQTGEITSNRGENWLSQDGDWGLIFDATPLINYVGNLFNGTAGNGGAALNNYFSSNSSKGSTVVIGAKKLVNANTAYRGMFRIGFGNSKSTEFVSDLTPNADPLATVEDVTKMNFFALDLGVGLEKRVGSTRVVGVYGAMFNVGFGNSKTTMEYGNPLAGTNPLVGRITEAKDGSTFKLGLAAFGGVEWFCAPKVSLSGEYTWGLAFMSSGATETSAESWEFTPDPDDDPLNGSIVTTTVEGTPNDEVADKTNSFGIDTGVTGAKIGLNFYFQ